MSTVTCDVAGNQEKESATAVPSSKLSKQDVKELVRKEDSRITYAVYTKSKSKVWDNFKIIKVDGDNVNFVKCNACPCVLAWQSKFGTKSLSRHQCRSNSTQLQKSKFSSASGPILKRSKRTASDLAVQELNKSILIGLAQDLVPLSTVECTSFPLIAQKFINFGATYGRAEISTILQPKKTMREKSLPEIVKALTKHIQDSILVASPGTSIVFTSDMYESSNSKMPKFLSLTAHYIDWNSGGSKLKKYLLDVRTIPDEKSSTYTFDLKELCLKILQSYFPEAENILEQSVAVTLGGLNMLEPFSKKFISDCYRLNTLMENIFSSLKTKCPKLYHMLSSMKKLVTYFKQSGLHSKLSPEKLKKAESTKWTSNLIMLQSYIKSSKKVKYILEFKDELHMLIDLEDEELIQELVDFLIPFVKCLELISSERCPTINRVAFLFHHLEIHLRDKPADSQSLRELKEEAQKLFQKYCYLTDIHYAACMLDPR
jgi:hypothetical protein